MADRGRELRSRGSALGRGSLAALLGITAVAVILSAASWGCSVSTPERTVEEFVSARIDGDEKRAADLTLEGDLSDFAGGEPFLRNSGVTFVVETAETRGDRSSVTVRYGWEGGSAELPYVCRRQGTRWKVALRETEELWLEGLL